ncbi:hypothetical protein HY024_03045 [Candidatus Curtissbacteria bacterium]|nr:hypothetical protein [Candidatus Curtissbacteria bacterium]
MSKFIQALLVITVSLIYGLPNLILFSKLGNNYTPFTLSVKSPIARDKTYAYGPEANFILNNKSFLKEVYVEEYKNSPTPFMGETAPAVVVAALAAVLGSLERAFIVSDFIFPPLIFLAFLQICRIFIKNKWLALSTAFVTITSRDFIAVIPYPDEIFKYLTVQENQNYLLYFSRSFHPQVSFLFLISAILLVFKVVQNPTKYKWIVLLGICFGLVFYSYIFYWTLLVFFYSILFFYFLIKKDIQTVKSLFLSGAIALFISSFYLINMIYFYQLPFINDFVAKSSLDNVPVPLMLLRYLFLILTLLLVVKNKNKQFAVLVSLLCAGVFITPISKFLIGQDLETLHYLRRAIMPFATIALSVILYNFFKKKETFLKISAFLIFIIFFAFSLATQQIATEKIIGAHIRDVNLEAVMHWLNTNTQKSTVVGSINTDFSSLIPLYTNDKVYVPPADRTLTPTYEGVERYKILSEILGINISVQKQKLADQVSYFFIYQSYNQNRNLDPNSPRKQQADRQIDTLSAGNAWKQKVKSYKLDYVVVTPSELKEISPNMNYLSFVTSINEYLIFRIK